MFANGNMYTGPIMEGPGGSFMPVPMAGELLVRPGGPGAGQAECIYKGEFDNQGRPDGAQPASFPRAHVVYDLNCGAVHAGEGKLVRESDGRVVHEGTFKDGEKKVGMVYKRDHGEGRSIFWVYDLKGDRRGFVTPDNRAFAYEHVLGTRSDKASFIGSDTISASARKVIGHDRPVNLVEIDIETWAGSGG